MIKDITVGSIAPRKSFELNLTRIFIDLEKELGGSNNYQLKFYSYEIRSSGYKFRHEVKTDKWVLLTINYDNNLNIKELLKDLYVQYECIDDKIERDYRRLNCIGEYFDPNHSDYDDSINFMESLDNIVYLEVIKL